MVELGGVDANGEYRGARGQWYAGLRDGVADDGDAYPTLPAPWILTADLVSALL